MFQKVDCIRIKVPTLEEGLEFYHHKLNHKILWRTENAIGLQLNTDQSEIVIHTDEEEGLEIDFKVLNVNQAIQEIQNNGGKVIKGPFEINIGLCAVIQDPWGHEYIILDSSKGKYEVDENKNVVGLH